MTDTCVEYVGGAYLLSRYILAFVTKVVVFKIMFITDDIIVLLLGY